LDAGWKIAKAHLWFGVGTGDVKQAFKDYYESINSPLKSEWRRRAHNQFLTFIIALGITGLIVCLVSLVAPLFLARRERSFLAVGFIILMMISMLNEDTLETSSGAVFTAFFIALFIFGPDYPWLRRKLFSRNG
jgi:O-antigen ligase